MRERSERMFAGLGSWAFRRRFSALLVCLAVAAAAASPLGRLRVESSTESFFHEEDPALVAYEDFQEVFGKDDYVIVALQARSVFDRQVLQALAGLHRALESGVPHLARITSLVNARRTRGEGDRLIIEDLMPVVPESPEGMAALRAAVLSNPLYANRLVSGDGSMAAILLEPLAYRSGVAGRAAPTAGGKRAAARVGTAEYAEMYEAIRAIAEPYRASGIVLHYAGSPVITSVLDRAVLADSERLAPLAFLVSVVFLSLFFRRVSGVVFPLLVVTFSVASTLGAMAAIGISLSLVTSMLPSFLVVVGVADSVHILALFYRRYGEHGDRGRAVAEAFGQAGLAVLMTSLTTAAGLLSFVSADVASVADLGAAAPIGVALAMFYTFLLLPALLGIFPVSRPAPAKPGSQPLADRMLTRVGELAVRRRWAVVGVSVVVLALAVAGMTRLRLSHNALKWFPEDHELRVATTAIDGALKGSVPFEVVIDTGRENGLYDAAMMQRLEGSVRTLEQYRRGPIAVGKAVTVTSVIKEVNCALNENRPEFYAVPDDDGLIAQELILFEMSGSDDLEDLVTADYRKARFTLTVPFEDAILYKGVLDDIRNHFREQYPGLAVTTTGVLALLFETVHNLLRSMVRSYLIAFTVVTALMILLLGRLRIGLLSMVPNLLPIAAVAGLMGWLDIPFDFATMLIGSLAIGLVVDDTIHFLHHFRREYESGADVPLAVGRTLRSTGRAIFVTSATLASGFLVYTMATLKSSVTFGVLTSATVLLAMLADFFLTPALMAIVLGRRSSRTGGAGASARKAGGWLL